MALKQVKVVYTARNFQTGLADVKANVFKANGAGVYTSVAANLSLTEIDATNMPGLYSLVLTPVDLAGYGGAGTYLIKIDSVSKPAPAAFKLDVLLNNEDDLEAHLAAIETKIDTLISGQASLATTVGQVHTLATATNTTIQDPVVGNANIKALIDSVLSAVQSVQNNTSFVAVVAPELVVPPNGNNTYEIPIRVFDTTGKLEDPDTNSILVSVKNEAGLDRTNLIQGYTSGPVAATRDGQGKYHVKVVVPYTAGLEQLIFSFDYSEGGEALNYPRVSETVADVQASGFALQSTVLDILTDTSDIQPKVVSLLSLASDPVSGFAAIKALIDTVKGVADNSYAALTSGTYGLSALKTMLETKSSQSSVDAVNTAITDLKGASFDSSKDSLKAISDRTYFGGNAL